MNGFDLALTLVLIVVLAAAAGIMGWGIVRGISTLSHHSFHRRGHRS